MTQYATLAVFKRYLTIPPSDTQDDDLLSMALTSASAVIDKYTSRIFVAATDSTRKFDTLLDVEGLCLWLDNDLAQLTSVQNGDGVAVTLGNLVLTPSVGPPYYALTLKRSAGLSWTYTTDSEQAISVTGRWAYSLTPPDDIVQATLRLAQFFYRQPQNAFDLNLSALVGSPVFMQANLPVDVVAILCPYRRLVP